MSRPSVETVRHELEKMPVGNCGVRWDVVVWRVASGYIVGDSGVRVDGYVHSLESAVDHILWKKHKWNPGDTVICNGNSQARVIGQYSEGMYEVRLWDGLRHVGDVCVPGRELVAR